MVERILVGLDGFLRPRHVLEKVAERTTARGEVIDAVAPCCGAGVDSTERSIFYVTSREVDLWRVRADEDPAVTTDPLVREGDPAQKLCDLAADAELLAGSCRGRGTVAPLLRKSVATTSAYHHPPSCGHRPSPPGTAGREWPTRAVRTRKPISCTTRDSAAGRTPRSCRRVAQWPVLSAPPGRFAARREFAVSSLSGSSTGFARRVVAGRSSATGSVRR